MSGLNAEIFFFIKGTRPARIVIWWGAGCTRVGHHDGVNCFWPAASALVRGPRHALVAGQPHRPLWDFEEMWVKLICALNVPAWRRWLPPHQRARHRFRMGLDRAGSVYRP